VVGLFLDGLGLRDAPQGSPVEMGLIACVYRYMFIHRHALLDVVIASGDCLFVLELHYSIILLLRTYRRNLTLQRMIMELVYEQTIRYYTSRKHAQYVQGSYVDK
jgi:hypothetical protein